MQQSHFSSRNDLQLSRVTPGFAINESETLNHVYTNTAEAENTKASSIVLSKTHLPSPSPPGSPSRPRPSIQVP